MSIEAAIIDSREPQWVQELQFHGAPTSVSMLEAGDVWLACSDGKMLIVERKTPEDFLNTLKGERLFPQVSELAKMRQEGYWPYVMITGDLQRGANGKVFTPKETGWSWAAVQGTLLSIQEMGVYVTFCAGDTDFSPALERLAKRDRSETAWIRPARDAKILGIQASFIAGLPGIGIEKVGEIMKYAGTPAWALVALTDSTSKIPGIGPGIKNNIRYALGLKEGEQIVVNLDDQDNEILAVCQEAEK